jgi:hypothetical protein
MGNANNLPYTSNIVATGVLFDQLNMTAGTGGNPGMTVVCGPIINCTFSNAPMTLTVAGGSVMFANIGASSIALTRAGGKCPSMANWSATYFSVLPSTSIFPTN